MIKNQKGITLVVLICTVVLMTILVGVTVNLGYNSMDHIVNNKLTAELGIVRQAITEQYMKANAVKQTMVLDSKPPVSYWIGTKIEDFNKIDLPNINEIKKNAEIENFYQKEANYTCQYQEDYYYRLMPEDLQKIGVQDAKDTYIVNYRTGEVYNETQKINKSGELLYLPSINDNNSENETDTTSFNDWDEIE